MKEGFRQCMAWLHTWTGLVVGWILFFVFVTGTAGYAAYEIDRWMRPELPMLTQEAKQSAAQQLQVARQYLEANAEQARSWTIQLPGGRSQPYLRVFWQEPPQGTSQRGRFHNATLDAETGQAVPSDKVRATGGGQQLYRMHYALHYIPYDWAIRIVGVCTMLMLLAIVSGVITHKKIFVDLFTFRPGKGQRSWLDAHNLVSVTSLPFFVMITYSGLIFFMFQYMPAGMEAAFGSEPRGRNAFNEQLYPDRSNAAAGQAADLTSFTPLLPQAEAQWGAGQVSNIGVQNPGDTEARITFTRRHDGGTTIDRETLRFNGVTGAALPSDSDTQSGARQFQSVMLDLHEGRFAGWSLRWLYLLVSFLGCAMIATGLVLWTSKRKVKQDKRLKAGQSIAFGFRLVETLNIGTIAGLCTAIAAYFWANRLLPVDMANRAAWEMHCLFITWGVLLLYTAIRLRFASAVQVWQEQLWLTTASLALLPLLNLLTSDKHLGRTIPAGDWVLASCDLTMWALAVFFAMAALKVRRKGKQLAQAPQSNKKPAAKEVTSTAKETAAAPAKAPHAEAGLGVVAPAALQEAQA